MKAATFLLAIVVLLGGMTSAVMADVTIEMKHDGESQTIYATDQMFCAEYPDGTTIFRGDKRLLWNISKSDGKYFEITESDLKEIGEKIGKMKAEMEEAMKNVPAEQRAMVEKMMAGKMPAGLGGEEPALTVKELGQSKAINGFRSSGYEVFSDGELKEEVWSAQPKELGLAMSDFKVLQDFASFLQSAIPGMNDMVAGLAKDYENPGDNEVPGFPVLTIRKDGDGNEKWRSELVRVDKADVPVGRFELPEGLKKEKMNLGG